MIDKATIPKHWQIIKTAAVGKLLRGVNYKKEEASNEPKKDYLPILRGNNINGELNFDDLVYVQRKNINEGQHIKKGDIVFAMSSGSKHLVGKSAKAKADFNGAFGAFCGVFRADKNIHKDFIAYFFQSPYYKKLISEISKGTNINNLKREHILDLDFPYPPLPEQQAIVSKIEELFSELDNGIAQLKTVQQQLKVYRQSLLKWAFEGKLTNKNVKEGELPEGWKWMKLGEVAKVSGGLTKNSKRESLTLRVPFLRVGNVYFNRLDLVEMHSIGIKNVEMERVRLEKNDLLFVEGNGSIEQIGRVALWTGEIKNCVHQNHLIKARFSKSVFPKYALYFYCSKSGRDNIKKQANSTSGLHTLNLSKISNLELPITTLKEQQLIVSELESKLTVCDKIEETISQSLQQAETLRQSILKKAFSGELVKNHANPKII